MPLEAAIYTSRTPTTRSIARVTLTTRQDNSVIRPGYNEANLLERVEANLRGAQQNGQPLWTPFVTDIDYDAKGQRTLIDYGNGVRTTYAYDPLTFRLTHLRTRRGAASAAGPALHLRPDGQHHPHPRRRPADHLLQQAVVSLTPTTPTTRFTDSSKPRAASIEGKSGNRSTPPGATKSA